MTDCAPTGPNGCGAVSLNPVSQDDVFKARHVVDGVLAPDAACAVFVVSETHRAKDPVDDAQRASLWRVNIGDGKVRRLTASAVNSGSPHFSPDGLALYFLSARDSEGKDNQIQRLWMDGGEAEAVTHIEGGVAAFALSPDGRNLAFVSSGEPLKCRGPRDHVRIDRLNYRFDPLPGFLQDYAHAIFVVSPHGGEPEKVTSADGLISAMVWSPDSKKITFVRTASKSNTNFGYGNLCLVELGHEETVLVENQLIQLPFWSDDGKFVGFCAPPDGSLARQGQAYLIDVNEGKPVSRTGSLNGCAPSFFQINSPAARFYGVARVPEGGDAVFLTIGDGGEGRITRIALFGSEDCQPIISGERICKIVDLRAGKILFTAQDCNTPSELYLANLDGSAEIRLTDFNSFWQKEYVWPDVMHLRVESEPGLGIETWVLVPKDVSPPHRTVLYIHGGPHAAFGWSYNEDMHELAGAGYAVVFANPRGSLGYGDPFSTAITGRWGQLEFIDFQAVLDELVARGIADPKRIGVTGVSGGGHLAAWLITHTDRFSAAVPEQGVYNMFSMYGVSDAGSILVKIEMGGLPHERPEAYWNLSPIAHAHECHTPTLLIQGVDDVRCPMQQAEELFTALKVAGCEVELVRLNCNHGLQMVGPPHLRRYRMDAMKDWFASHIDQH